MFASDNARSADNQQERLDPWWIVGFVDGEGCFSISRFKNATCKSGYQTLYEFVVTQGERSKKSLEEIQKFFNCGHIYINRRYDNHTENIYRYCVRKQIDLKNTIVPFFKAHPLQTAKQNQFNIFCKALFKGLESSETTR
jgi:hypothetical protein